MRDVVTFRAIPLGKRKVYDSNPTNQRYIETYQPRNYALGKDWVVSTEPLEGTLTENLPLPFIRSLYARKNEKGYFTFTKEEWRSWEDLEITEDTVVQYGRYYLKPALHRRVGMKLDFKPLIEQFEGGVEYPKVFVLLNSSFEALAKLQPWYIFGGPKDTEYWAKTEHVQRVLSLLNSHYKVNPTYKWLTLRDQYHNVPDLARNHRVQQFFVDHKLYDDKHELANDKLNVKLAKEDYINFMINLQNSAPAPVATGNPEHPFFELYPGRAATDEEVAAIKFHNPEHFEEDSTEVGGSSSDVMHVIDSERPIGDSLGPNVSDPSMEGKT